MPVYLRTDPTQLWFQSMCDECGRTIHEGELVTIATRLRSITDVMEYSIYCYPPCLIGYLSWGGTNGSIYGKVGTRT